MKDKEVVNKQLRNNEYFRKQFEADYLYQQSKKGVNFYNLIDRISDKDNIRLAYRNIKSNTGSRTPGLSGRSLTYIANMPLRIFLKNTKRMIKYYRPGIIRKVGIPKANGKIRNLGIKEPEDKIVEQSILQILDPIIQAKFHNNSNGFIKGRSCHRAISQMINYIVKDKLYFVVDIDIKGFFDNVNHGKLIKQLWSLGIRDKELLSIISKMLKAEIFKVGIPDKGTPQGGILSPLLANVYLNELDWWLDSKETMGIRFVRYADDFKILCPNYYIAKKMLIKTKEWLHKRLKLEVSEEKTKIVNLKRNYSEFLGFKIKIKETKGKTKIVSHMKDKAKANCKEKVKKQLRIIKQNIGNPKKLEEEINQYNSIVRGIHNYYDDATMIYVDLKEINKIVSNYIGWNFRECLEYKEIENPVAITEKYGKDKKFPLIRGHPLIPIGRIRYDVNKRINDSINYYKESSRNTFYKNLGIYNEFMFDYILNNPLLDESVELNDNIIPRFCGQLGKCNITGKEFMDINKLKIVKIHENKFSNKYNNIILVESKVYELIKKEKVDDIIEIEELVYGLNKLQLEKINKIRKENNRPLISL